MRTHFSATAVYANDHEGHKLRSSSRCFLLRFAYRKKWEEDSRVRSKSMRPFSCVDIRGLASLFKSGSDDDGELSAT